MRALPVPLKGAGAECRGVLHACWQSGWGFAAHMVPAGMQAAGIILYWASRRAAAAARGHGRPQVMSHTSETAARAPRTAHPRVLSLCKAIVNLRALLYCVRRRGVTPPNRRFQGGRGQHFLRANGGRALPALGPRGLFHSSCASRIGGLLPAAWKQGRGRWPWISGASAFFTQRHQAAALPAPRRWSGPWKRTATRMPL